MELLSSFNVDVTIGPACRTFETFRLGAGSSDIIFTEFADLAAAASSLIVLAAFRTVPLRPMCEGGGMSSASLAAFRSATVCLGFETSLCDISFRLLLDGLFSSRPLLDGLLSSSEESGPVMFDGAFQSVTVEVYTTSFGIGIVGCRPSCTSCAMSYTTLFTLLPPLSLKHLPS